MPAPSFPKLAGLGIRPELLEARDRHAALPLVLVKAPAGSGKTSLLRAWQARIGGASGWLDLDETHADLALFAEDLVGALRQALGAHTLGAELVRALPHLERLTAPTLWRYLRRDLAALREPFVVFLDNYHRLPRGSGADQLVSAMLRDDANPVRFVVATRGTPPQAAARLLAEGRATRLDHDALELDEDQVRALLAHFGVDPGDASVGQVLEATRGWATGVVLAARGLAGIEPEQRGRFVEALAGRADLFEYVAGELLADEEARAISAAELAAVLGPCTRETLAEALSGDASGAFVQRAIDRGLLLEEDGRVLVHPLWESLLLRRLRERVSHEEWRGLHERLAARVESIDARRAVVILARGEVWEGLVALLARHGREWLNLGRDEFVTRHVSLLPDPLRREHARIEYLEALAMRRRDVDLALDALVRVAERLRAEGLREDEVSALFDAQILAANRNRRDLMAKIARRVLSLRRIATDPRVRAVSLLGLAFAAMMSGRSRIADSILRRVNTRALLASERSSAPLLRLTLLRQWGRWDESLELVEAGLSDPEIREHAPSVLMLELERSFIEGHRAPDPGEAIEAARRVRSDLAEFGLTVNEAMARETVGLLESRAGRHAVARAEFLHAAELAESIARLDFAAQMHVLAAREHVQEQRWDAARLEARQASAIYEQLPPKELRVLQGAAGVVLCARILAECGELEEARRTAELVPASSQSNLPLVDFAAQIQRARLAELEGDARGTRRYLRRAAALAEAADLRDAPAHLEPKLLSWAGRTARATGVDWLRLGYEPSAAASAWAVRSLGGLHVTYAGTPIPEKAWRGATTRRLLLRLLCAGPGGVRRELLEAELWPDHPGPRSQANLRVALSRLRGALAPHGTDAIRIEGDRIDVSEELRAGWDVDRLERALAGDDLSAERLRLYRGSFAPEVFDTWAESVRSRIEPGVSRGVQKVVDRMLAEGDVSGALTLVETFVEQMPSDEALWRRRVELHLAAGDRNGARRALHGARVALERELGIPADEALSDVAALVGGDEAARSTR